MAPSYSETYTTFVSSTLNARMPDVVSQIRIDNPLLAWALSHKKPQVGGRNVFIPLEYGQHTTSFKRALGRGGSIPIAQDEIITECWYSWTTYGHGMCRYRDDDLENTGKYQVFNKLRADIDNMIYTFKQGMELDLLSTESTGANKFCGLRGLVEDVDCAATATTQTAGSNTVGNLARTTYPWFTNWGRNMTGLDPGSNLTYYMREACNNVQHYTGALPEVIITHYVAKDLYEDECGETLRTMQVNLGDIGYKLVEWKGIPFLTSPQATTTRMYFMGKNTVELMYEPRMWFKSTPWKPLIQQPFDYVQQVLAKGQFCIKKPRGCSVIYNINN